jgi:nitrous oxidase accessory protein NosD
VVPITRLSAALVLAVLALLVQMVAPRSPAAAGESCDRFAATSGSDGGSGSRSSPYRTPQKLIDSLAPGQTGCFRAGTYRFSELDVTKANITLAPRGSEAVTLRGSIKVKPSGHDSTIRGMKLDGRGGASPIGPRIYADRVVLRDNRITNRHTSICVQIGRYYSDPAPRGVVIERNRIHDCGALPSTNKDHGIYVSEAKNTVIRDNWIYDNADRGVQLYPDAQRTRVVGNVVFHNGDGIVVNGAGSSVPNHNVVKGNIIAKSYRGYNVYSGTTGPVGRHNALRKNCVWAGKGGSPYQEHGGVMKPARNYRARRNVIAKPRFARAKAGNFRLRGGGRCVARYKGTLSRR